MYDMHSHPDVLCCKSQWTVFSNKTLASITPASTEISPCTENSLHKLVTLVQTQDLQPVGQLIGKPVHIADKSRHCHQRCHHQPLPWNNWVLRWCPLLILWQLKRFLSFSLRTKMAEIKAETQMKDALLTKQQQQPFYGPLSGTTRMSQYRKKHSPTHHPDHPIFISFLHLPQSIASSLFKLRAW